MTALTFLLATSQRVAVETGLLPSGEDFGLLVNFLLYSFFAILFVNYTFNSAHVLLHVRFLNVLLDCQQDYFLMELFV